MASSSLCLPNENSIWMRLFIFLADQKASGFSVLPQIGQIGGAKTPRTWN
jgi:hypothetical protein